jgi:hypothetical protein
MYIAITTRALEGRKGRAGVPGGLGDAIDSTAADVRVAHELSYNSEEFLWVKERVLEADAALDTARLNTDVLALLDRTLGELKTRRQEAPDEASRTLLSEQIGNFEAEAERTRREARRKEPDAVRANIKVLEPYRARLNGLQTEVERVARELGTAKKSPANATPTPKTSP